MSDQQPPQGYPSQGYPPQNYSPQQQGYPSQGYPPQNYSPQQQGYPPQQQDYPQNYSPQQGYPQNYSPQQGYPPQQQIPITPPQANSVINSVQLKAGNTDVSADGDEVDMEVFDKQVGPKRRMGKYAKIALVTAGVVAAALAGIVIIGGAAIVYNHYRKKAKSLLKVGDSIDIDENEKVRVVLRWDNEKGVDAEKQDLDISCFAFDANDKKQDVCFFNKPRILYGAVQLSGDAHSGTDADEKIDLNLKRLREMGITTLVFNCTSHGNVTFDKFKSARIDIMEDLDKVVSFDLDNLGPFTAVSMGRICLGDNDQWYFEAMGVALDGVNPTQLEKFIPWMIAPNAPRFPTKMYIYVSKGTDLLAVDANGKSDPYAEMGLFEQPSTDDMKGVFIKNVSVSKEELQKFLEAKFVEEGWATPETEIIEKITNKANALLVLFYNPHLTTKCLEFSGCLVGDSRIDIFRPPDYPAPFEAAGPVKVTSVIKHTVNPEWKECLKLIIPRRFFLPQYLGWIKVNLHDEDRKLLGLLKSEKPMGYAKLNFFETFLDAALRLHKGKKFETKDKKYEVYDGRGTVTMRVGFKKPKNQVEFKLQED